MRLDIWKKRNESPGKDSDKVILTDLLTDRETGMPARCGPLEMIPLLGSSFKQNPFACLTRDIEISSPPLLGNLSITNRSELPMIIPMHLGVLSTDKADHFLSESAVIMPGERLDVSDAFTIPEHLSYVGRPGKSGLTWLPHMVKNPAFLQKHKKDYSRLWPNFEKAVELAGMKGGADSEKFTSTRERLKLSPGQTGAVFMIYGNIVGIELAPDPEFWEDIHPLLVTRGYGPLCLMYEDGIWEELVFTKLDIDSIRMVGDMKAEFEARLKDKKDKVLRRIYALNHDEFEKTDLQETGPFRRISLDSHSFSGEAIYRGDHLTYLSLFHKRISQV